MQGGTGGIWIYDTDDNELAENIDYAAFNSEVLDLAFNSNDEDGFRTKYSDYLENLVS